jgi:hypothetical protein
MKRFAIALAMVLGLVNAFVALNAPVSYAQEAPEPEKPEKPDAPGD